MSIGAPSRPSAPARSPLGHPAIEAIWIAAAQEIGWTVERTSAAFATSDGRRTISIGVDDVLDSDDAVAQLVFHELCHGLVQGPACWAQADWGLSNGDDRDVIAEHACLRVQIHLAAPHGLRGAMAPTTEYRAYHDAVTGDPLHDAADPAAARARQALERPESKPWIAALEGALGRTRLILDGARSEGEPPSPPSSAAAGPGHPVGFPWGPAGETCGSCAWLYVGGRGPGVERCRQAGAESAPEGHRTSRDQPACERWEPPVDCQTCGACCREAYHSVTVSVRDPVVWKQPDLIARHGHRFEILRKGPRCAALHDRREESPGASDPALSPLPSSPPAPAGADAPARAASARAALLTAAPASVHQGAAPPTFACTIYDDRPRACRDFEAGGRHCLVARRRVGLSV